MASLDMNYNVISDIQAFNEKRAQLSNQFTTQHKDIWSIFRMRSDVSEPRTICLQLHAYSNTIDKAYKREACHFKSSIGKLNSRVDILQHKVRDIQSTGECVSRIKALMQEIESCIETLRNSQRVDFDELQHEEHRLGQEIMSHERRFEVWERKKFNVQTQNKVLKVPLEVEDSENGNTHPDIKNFREFLVEHGGHTGGWDELDHATFVKHRLKHKSCSNLAEALHPFIPVHTIEQIQRHEHWYVQYTELCNRNRAAIKAWRERQFELRAEQKYSAAEIDLKVSEKEREVKSKRDQRLNEHRISKQAALTEWRLSKERDAAKMRARQRDIEDKGRSEVEKERAWKEAVRLQVAEYISKRNDAEKEMKVFQLGENCVQRERGKLANVGVAKFLVRDREAAELKKQKADELLQQALVRQNMLDKLRDTVRVEGTRNADRTTGMTEVWKSREKANQESRNPKCTTRETPVVMLGAHRLATPSWRQNL